MPFYVGTQCIGYIRHANVSKRQRVVGMERAVNQSINQSINFILLHTNSVSSNNKIANTFRLCVTGSTQGAYAPHKRATHVQ